MPLKHMRGKNSTLNKIQRILIKVPTFTVIGEFPFLTKNAPKKKHI